MSARTPTRGRPQAHSSPATSSNRRHSLSLVDDGAVLGVLRQEQSSPAVVQQTGAPGSLLKQVVSASGQGCAAAVANSSPAHGAVQQRGATIWRTRSVRSKAESYCILHLKGCSSRGIVVQVRAVVELTTSPVPAGKPRGQRACISWVLPHSYKHE